MPAKNFFLIILILLFLMLLLVYVNMNSRLKKHTIISEDISSNQKSSKEKFNGYIIPQEQLVVIQGVSIPHEPIKPVSQFDKDPSAPPIDGDANSPNQMFSLAFNKTSPECCMDSMFSTSQGCVCLTDKQRNWFSQRGNNNTARCGNSGF